MIKVYCATCGNKVVKAFSDDETPPIDYERFIGECKKCRISREKKELIETIEKLYSSIE